MRNTVIFFSSHYSTFCLVFALLQFAISRQQGFMFIKLITCFLPKYLGLTKMIDVSGNWPLVSPLAHRISSHLRLIPQYQTWNWIQPRSDQKRPGRTKQYSFALGQWHVLVRVPNTDVGRTSSGSWRQLCKYTRLVRLVLDSTAEAASSRPRALVLHDSLAHQT